MEKIQLGEGAVIERNYKYLLIAKENGFFQDGYFKDDITTCSDWVVTWWIDEIGDLKKDKQKFVEEILPNFKRWFSNGLESTGVGLYYESLKFLERKGIKINKDSFICLTSLLSQKEINFDSDYTTYSSISNHFQLKELADNLANFKNKGIPVSYLLSSVYDNLTSLVNKGKKIDYDTFILFATSNDKLSVYDDKEYIENNYNYSTNNGNEIERLNAWLHNGGYNLDFIKELETRKKKYEEALEHNNSIYKSGDKICTKINQEVKVDYYVLGENGERDLLTVEGTLIACDYDSITLNVLKDGIYKRIVIGDKGKSVIFNIKCDGKSIYQFNSLKGRITIESINKKINEIKSENVLNKYFEKFQTVEGLAYLKRYAIDFINCVDVEHYPVDNLFAFCFESIAEFSLSDVDQCLQLALLAYNRIMSGEFEYFNKINFGYPLNKFLSKEVLPKIRMVCLQVSYNELEQDLSSFSEDDKSTGKGVK